MPFRLRAKYLFLTYAQTNFEPAELLEHIHTLAPAPSYTLLAQELHQDGQPHIHAAIAYSSRISISDERFYDFNGIHPNIQQCRSWDAVLHYVSKDGQLIERGERPFSSTRPDLSFNLFDLARSHSIEEFYELSRQRRVPFGYADKAWKHVQAPPTTPTTLLDDTPVPGHVRVPLLSLRSFDRSSRTSPVVVGPTGCGKTTWAMLQIPKPALIVTHIDDLKAFVPGHHVAILFDDMAFHHMPLQAQIHLVDFDLGRSIHCRYNTAYIPAGIFKIFTCNDYPFTEHAAIRRRTTLIDCSEPYSLTSKLT